MVIHWSDDDDAYLETLPDGIGLTPTPSTHGATHADAVRNGEEVLGMLIESLLEDGESLSEAKPALTAV